MDSQNNKNSNIRIIKSGTLQKRSKYLKIWKSRFIVLTNKNLFAFTDENKDADCTMNLILKSCGRVDVCDNTLNKPFTFSVNDESHTYYFQAASDQERNEWFRAIQLEISNPTDEKEEIEFDKIDNKKNFK